MNGPIDQLCQRADAEAYQRGYEQGKKDALLQKENLQVSTVIGYESGYEEGAKAEREHWQIERDKLIAVIDEKIANARVAATNKVLDELAQMYANIPEQFLKGTYRLHSEWKAKIESLHTTPSKQERDPE